LIIDQTNLTASDQTADPWSMQFFFNTVDWVNGLTLTTQTFDPPLSWSIPSANSLRVQWDGGSLPLAGFAATLQNEATTQPVPEPTTALLMLGGLTVLAAASRRVL